MRFSLPTIGLLALLLMAPPLSAQERRCATCEPRAELQQELERSKAELERALESYRKQLELVMRDSSRAAYGDLLRLQREMRAAQRQFDTQVSRFMAEEASRLERQLQEMAILQQEQETRVQSPREAQEPRGWLGVTFSSSVSVRAGDKGEALWIFHGYPTIESVEPGSPADRAGVASGDRLVAVNGRDVRRGVAFGRLLEPGRKLPLRLERGGERKELTLLVAPRPQSAIALRVPVPPEPPEPARAPAPRQPRAAPRVVPVPAPYGMRDALAMAGAAVMRIDDDLGQYFGVDQGVLLLQVARGSPVANSGLAAGDVIVSVNGRAIRTPLGLRSAIDGADGRELKLLIVRKGERKEMVLTLARD
ncbi:MAG TPA: PDZ domain-containing protein [Gemmatimonadaceae bacterium]|nr:PDZ domain-containing protein [Gemmatimonadaceae bacterium]